MKRLMPLIVIAACLFAVYLLTSMPPKEETAPSESFVVPEVTINEDIAMQTYQSNCLSCHGDGLQGRYGPALNEVGASMSKEEIYKKIMDGGGGMPKFDKKLTEDQIVLLANWLAGKK